MRMSYEDKNAMKEYVAKKIVGKHEKRMYFKCTLSINKNELLKKLSMLSA